MKKFCIPLLLAASLTMTGCSLSTFEGALDSAINSLAEQALESVPPCSSEMVRFTVGNVSFDMDSAWIPMEGYEGSCCTPDRKTVYQLQGESMLGSYTPEEFFRNLCGGYRDKGYTLRSEDDTLTELALPDDAQALVGRIVMVENEVLFNIDVLLIPQKNTVLTFASQCAETNTPPLDIREISASVTVNAGTEDYISGNTFIADESSELCLAKDGTFIYYEHAGTPDSAYTAGTYEVYYGQAAIDKAVSMEEYGLTAEELERVNAANMNGYVLNSQKLLSAVTEGSDETYRICKDTFYTVILHNTVLSDSTGQQEISVDTMYIGYYLPELQFADMVNANSAGYAGWKLQGVTE